MKKEKARLQELRAMPYEEYRLTPEWQKTRKLALRRVDGRCQECDAEGVDLEIYHLNGDNLGCEQETDVIALCVECFNRMNGGPALEVPHVSLRHRLTVYGPAALVSVGLPALLHAPLPAEIGGLGAVIFLAIKCPTVYAAVKRGLPPRIVELIDSRAERAEQRRQSGEWSILDRLMGRHLQGSREDEDEEVSDEDLEAALRAMGIDEKDIADYMGEQYVGVRKEQVVEARTGRSLLPQAVFEAPVRSRGVSDDDIHELERLLEDVLSGFQVYANVLPRLTSVGPSIIRFGVVPTGVPLLQEDGSPKLNDAGEVVYSKRTRVEDITKREKDIQLALGAETIRILTPVPGRKHMGIEIPHPWPVMVMIGEVLASREYRQAAASSKLVFALGRDVSGQVRFCDLEKAPHVLIGGMTGAGKSVLLNVLIASILSQASPDDVRFLMVDPKRVELTPYNGIAHLLQPVVTDMSKVVPLLDQAITEMERRYKMFEQLGVRNLEGYRRKRVVTPNLVNLPSWVIIIDEFADLMMTASKEDNIEEKICRVAQMARATGIHLVVTTQRPVVKVVTGLIKSNLSTRIALKTVSDVDSRTILDKGGAESLLGNGDMLYLPSDGKEPIRIQGAYMTDEEAEEVAAHWQSGGKPQQYQAGEDRTLEVSTQSLDVDTLVSLWTEGRLNDGQFLTLMNGVSGRVTDDLDDEDQGFAERRLRVVPNASQTSGNGLAEQDELDDGNVFTDADRGAKNAEFGAFSGGSGTFQNVLGNAANGPVKPTERVPNAFLPRVGDKVLSDTQARLLVTYYQDCNDVKKALSRIKDEKGRGLGTGYYRHAIWILDSQRLRERA